MVRSLLQQLRFSVIPEIADVKLTGHESQAIDSSLAAPPHAMFQGGICLTL